MQKKILSNAPLEVVLERTNGVVPDRTNTANRGAKKCAYLGKCGCSSEEADALD